MSERLSRRRFLVRTAIGGLTVAAGGLMAYDRLRDEPLSYDPDAFPPVGNPRVAAVRASSYASDLEAIVVDGLQEVGADVKGRSVLIKPNFVEFDPASTINTDPRLIAASVLALRRLGASSVVVAEGPGHRRDTDYILTASGLGEMLSEVEAPFVDLNVAPVAQVPLSSSYTDLGSLWLPEPVVGADVVLSMPKMKAHHWVGVTLSLKNLFGCLPGRIYGWPKNVLHWKGIRQSILDIAGAIRPSLVIVDGITGMEGDGPIMGTPVEAGHLVFSTDPVAADATAARLMGIDPGKVDYLNEAGKFLGQADLEEVQQVGEDPERDATEFRLIEQFQYLRVGSDRRAESRDARGG